MDERLSVLWRSLAVCFALVLCAPAMAAATAVADPLLARQWALTTIGAAEAWTQSSGEGVLVAVLDSGVQLDHPDLAANIWTNVHELPGNGRDDDANGVVDDVHGASMFDLSADAGDDNGHGTHVAGIIAARRGNAIGGSGLAPAARIMPVKVLDASMSGTTETLALGIRYAVDNGARILNVSVNTDFPTESVKSAVRYAAERGAIIVASAGNSGRNIDVLPSYPAALSDPAVLGVAAQTPEGILWGRSNSGLLTVDLAAPGERIMATASGSSYGMRTGTSAAAAFVTASLALLSAARPDLPMSTLREAIVGTTRRSDQLAMLLGSGGSLDVGAAMHRVLGAAWSTAPAIGAPALRLRTMPKARAGSRVTVRWSASGADSVARWRVSLDGRVVRRNVAVTGARFSRRIANAGRHRWRVVGFDAGGAKVVAAERAFRVLHRR